MIIEDLPAGLTATVEPQKFLKIGKKAKKSFAVRATIPAQSNCGWDNSNDISLETTKVEYSDQETLSRIDHVEAVFPSN
ncbi:MAG: hypothetical protein ACLROH_07700 [Streptococcus sp.]